MKIKGLETTIKQTIYDFKDRKNYLENTLDTLNDNIISLNKDITRKDGQIAKQTEQINKAISLLKEQKNKLEEQESLLNKEKKDAQTQTDPYVDEHLKDDIERLKKWNNDLYNNIYDLKNQAQSDKEIRDQELADLRQQIDNLKDEHEKFLKEVENGMEGEGDALTPATITEEKRILWYLNVAINKLKNWENQFQNQTPEQVQEKINDLTAERDSRPTQQQLTNLQNQLNKELSWWDKWINDNSKATKVLIQNYDCGKEYQERSPSGLVYTQGVVYNTREVFFSLGHNSHGGCRLKITGIDNSGSSNWTEESELILKRIKTLFKEIYKYYKNQ